MDCVRKRLLATFWHSADETNFLVKEVVPKPVVRDSACISNGISGLEGCDVISKHFEALAVSEAASVQHSKLHYQSLPKQIKANSR